MLTGHLLGSDGGLGVDEVRLELREVRHDILVRILGRYSRYIYYIYLASSTCTPSSFPFPLKVSQSLQNASGMAASE